MVDKLHYKEMIRKLNELLKSGGIEIVPPSEIMTEKAEDCLICIVARVFAAMVGENIKVQLPEDMGCNIHLLVAAPKEVEIKRQKRAEPETVSVKKGRVCIVGTKKSP